ncbi:MAG TPA: hypothetical protein VF666_11385 [Pyrinomonadaceae bacterium]|jgi:hypothetical protein
MGRLFNEPENIQTTEDSRAPDKVMQDAFKTVIDHMQLHSGADEKNGHHRDYMTCAAPDTRGSRHRSESPSDAGARTVEQPQEQASEVATDGSEQPEIQRVLENILAHDGGEVVEQLKEQEAKIAAAECDQPEIGRLIDALYVPLLLSILELSDEQFAAEYPGGSPVSLEQRSALAEAILSHQGGCPRCSLKFSSDMQWEEHVKMVFSKTKRVPRLYV